MVMPVQLEQLSFLISFSYSSFRKMAPTTRHVYKENPKAKTKTKKRQATTGKKKSQKMTGVMPVLSASVRGDAVPSAIDTALLEDVLKGNKKEGLFDKIMKLADGAEDDPPVFFSWQNVEVFVQAIHAAQTQAAAPGGEPLPPDPLGLPAAVTEQNFKEASLLEYARVPGAPARLGTTCLPCTQAQVGGVGLCLLSSTSTRGSSASSPSECRICCRSLASTCLVFVRIL